MLYRMKCWIHEHWEFITWRCPTCAKTVITWGAIPRLAPVCKHRSTPFSLFMSTHTRREQH